MKVRGCGARRLPRTSTASAPATSPRPEDGSSRLPLRNRSCTFTTGVFQEVARNLCAALRRSAASAAASSSASYSLRA